MTPLIDPTSSTAVGGPAGPVALPDAPARQRIVQDLDSTLFVEAGAGSGKTTALVERVLKLVTSGRAELRAIAAITFTEKAGAELRDRIRRTLEETAHPEADTDVSARCRTAIDQLDGAAIGTLHSFAQRLLSENPVEAGLPPRVEVLDEVSSDVEFDRRWTTFRDQLLANPQLERTLLLLLASGVRPDDLRALALEFDRNWDLVEERIAADAPEPPPLHGHPQLEQALVELDRACAYQSRCTDHSDRLLGRLLEIERYGEELHSFDDELELLERLPTKDSKKPSFKAGGVGVAKAWGTPSAKPEVQAQVVAAGQALRKARTDITTECVRLVAAEIRGFTLRAAEERRADGRLAFHDLLVLARAVLRHPEHGPTVRRRLHERYQHLLLDELQDTDPIQIEMAVRIAAADPDSEEAGTAPWAHVAVTPGQLFFVGDPKQSIYRFRRADIETFLEARNRFGPEGGGTVELTANFRTVEPVIEWVNATFAPLMDDEPEVALPVASQPRYVALQATRPAPPEGPAVAVLGREELPSNASASDLRSAEAAAVAATIAHVVADGWSVSTGPTPGQRRPARLGDITVLVPTRTSLPFLEEALDDAGIAYRAESSSLVYATRAVRDLLTVVRAVDDPTDHLEVVAALRSSLFACGDDDLFRFKVERRGHWSYLADQPPAMPADDPVTASLAYLRELHHQRQWLAPSALLDRIARDRRSFELGFAEGRPRDVWRRLRYVIDQARGWSEATSGSLRQYLQWVARQTTEGARVAEAVLPETDDDAVRIMTIHAAKGLEFPVTILTGMSTRPQTQRARVAVVFRPTGEVGYRLGADVRTNEFDEWKPIDEQLSYGERIRLLYVACTRAKDHLVVSLQRKGHKEEPKADKRTNAEILVGAMGVKLDALPDAVDEAVAVPPVVPPPPPDPPPPFATWEAELTAALRSGSRPSTVAATALTDEGVPDAVDLGAGTVNAAPADHPIDDSIEDSIDDRTAGLQKRPRDLDLPPWLKGRYGTAVGRAVHGVLQTIDLATGDGLDHAVAAQCEAEAIPTRRTAVRRLVIAALESEVVRAAAAAPHWREVYACTPVGARLLEGYIDLLYRAPGGLMVVDYKTAATKDPRQLDQRADGYRLQGASYALAVERTTGEPVLGVTFLFLTPAGAVETAMEDLPAALAHVERLVAQGDEVVLG